MRSSLICFALLLATFIYAGTAEAELEIVVDYPTPGALVREGEFTLLYRLIGEQQGSGLDHVHWQIDDGPKPTAPDLSGVDQVTGLTEGEHTISVWMATVEHVQIGQKKIIPFRVAFSGLEILSNLSGTPHPSTDFNIFFGFWGNVPETVAKIVASLNSAQNFESIELTADATFLPLSNLSNGPYTLRLDMTDSAGTPIGTGVDYSFTINSAFTLHNINKAAGFLSRALKTKSKARQKTLRQRALVALREIANGGTLSPEAPWLSNAKIARIVRILGRKSGHDNIRSVLRSLMGR